jgi:hypothetical protein
MKSLLFFLPLFALASAFAVPGKVSYDGYKVIRLAVGNNVAQVNDIIDKLSLSTWKGGPKANGFADIVIPPRQIQSFYESTAHMSSEVMHNDLGASIAEESKFDVYVGMSTRRCFQCYLIKR